MSPCSHPKQGTPIHPRSQETGLSGPLPVKESTYVFILSPEKQACLSHGFTRGDWLWPISDFSVKKVKKDGSEATTKANWHFRLRPYVGTATPPKEESLQLVHIIGITSRRCAGIHEHKRIIHEFALD